LTFVIIGANVAVMDQVAGELERASAPRRDWLRRLLGFPPKAHRLELSELGIRRSRTIDVPVWILGILLAAAAAVAIGTGVTHSLSGDVAIGAATAFITVAGILVAVLQWRAGLAEKAVDALYRRIALANQMRLNASEGLVTDDEATVARERANDYRLYVSTELDSLEYALLRYRFGLGMSVLIASRAVNHFRGRCKASGAFLEESLERVDKGAYFHETKEVVRQIIKGVRTENEGAYALSERRASMRARHRQKEPRAQ
jgi:hypothetical protein